MDKTKILSEIISNQENLIKGLEEIYQNYKSGSDLDESDIIDRDDLSHQDEWNDSADNLETRINNANIILRNLKSLSTDKRTTIENGAIVTINNKNYIIGVAFPPIKINDITYIGISEKAPIFPLINGLNVNDTYSFNNINYKIEAIN